jgi:hypothetical protein
MAVSLSNNEGRRGLCGPAQIVSQDDELVVAFEAIGYQHLIAARR